MKYVDNGARYVCINKWPFYVLPDNLILGSGFRAVVPPGDAREGWNSIRVLHKELHLLQEGIKENRIVVASNPARDLALFEDGQYAGFEADNVSGECTVVSHAHFWTRSHGAMLNLRQVGALEELSRRYKFFAGIEVDNLFLREKDRDGLRDVGGKYSLTCCGAVKFLGPRPPSITNSLELYYLCIQLLEER
ncbi:uncharacterized protein PV07_08743 [Cladophialophora immunda]|uniref:Uncharacterized protein n=1 Tax=Cladophialophora immunda TaxID=569365 RepID=A0A0D2AKT1_9EURO|nr:uncharacterized protein PV07_08743 [Cladophialophora immunda]KIW25577.1 hypothetical protein PV07_08743 [Cladophialophora immunda]OQV07683.1 hypothetical protein CLAIMM_12083 [Cladophialophora immunda]